MRAIQLKKFGIDNLEITEVSKPNINDSEILVKITAASLQYLDLHVINGSMNPELQMPHIPGTEGAGFVEEVGKR